MHNSISKSDAFPITYYCGGLTTLTLILIFCISYESVIFIEYDQGLPITIEHIENYKNNFGAEQISDKEIVEIVNKKLIIAEKKSSFWLCTVYVVVVVGHCIAIYIFGDHLL